MIKSVELQYEIRFKIKIDHEKLSRTSPSIEITLFQSAYFENLTPHLNVKLD